MGHDMQRPPHAVVTVRNIAEAHKAFGRNVIYYNVLKYEAEAVSSPRFIQPSNCIKFRTVEIVISNLRAEGAAAQIWLDKYRYLSYIDSA